jgi:hypothetical protein
MRPRTMIGVLRKDLGERYGLTRRQLSKLGWTQLRRLENCKSEAARLVLLGIKKGAV